MRRCRCCASRRAKASNPTPSKPATSLINARSRPSLILRASAASGSRKGPPGVSGSINATGKHAVPGSRLAGSPSVIKLNIMLLRPLTRNAFTSAFTQRDCAEVVEQMTTKALELFSAAVRVLPKSPELGSSSRSRNILPSLAGMGPSRPGAPTKLAGTR